MQDIEAILCRVAQQLRATQGVEAIVLGGSRALGTQEADSDIDIGLYYTVEGLLDLTALQASIDTLHTGPERAILAAPGQWGRWVNGGAWLEIDGIRVDLLLRDLARVCKAVEAADRGSVTAHYQPGHPHAFFNVMYRGELAACRVLWASSDSFARLKAQAQAYPERLRDAIVGRYLPEADFSLALARKSAGSHDAYYCMAHIVRAVSCLNQVIFAHNHTYCLNEKKAVRRIGALLRRPEGYAARVEEAIALAAADLPAALGILTALAGETRALVE